MTDEDGSLAFSVHQTIIDAGPDLAAISVIRNVLAWLPDDESRERVCKFLMEQAYPSRWVQA